MEEIKTQLRAVIKQVFDLGIEPAVVPAPENQPADYATNVAMQLSGRLENAAPRDIANKIALALSSDRSFPFTVEIAGPGFLNFISQDEYFMQKLAEMRTDFLKTISQNEYQNQTVICEFSDPNPFKVLHVGHLYTSIMGESISRLVEFSGGHVIRANFGGDVGLHVAKTMYAMLKKPESLTALMREDYVNKDDDYHTSISGARANFMAECYVEGTRAYDDDDAAHAEITQLNSKLYQIAAKGENNAKEDDSLAKTYWLTRKWSYDYFEEFYARIGVKFDKYYPESTVAARGLKEVSSHIGPVYEESDGAVIFPGEKYDLHTRVFINKDGLPTYEAKDVGLIFTKWDDYHFDQSIVITGNDIIDYMKVVLKSVSLYAPELTTRTKHLTHGNVRLPGNEKMSSRKGNFIKAVDILDAVIKEVKDDETIALGAIKYAFLKYKIGGNIEFDLKESVSTTGNSGVYLQYSAVRAQKILEQVTARGVNYANWELLPPEKALIRKLCEYPEVLKTAVKELAPHKIANFLYEAAQEFSKFYEKVKVTGSDHEAERAEIVRLYLDTITHGLNLLGITVPEEM